MKAMTLPGKYRKVSFVDATVPLGGIEVVVEAEDIDAAIDHLAESTVEASE